MNKNLTWLLLAMGITGLLLLLFNQQRLEANGTTFTVNSEIDERDDDPGDGICETEFGNGVCTLRAAVQETNALPGPDTIILPPGNYVLTIIDVSNDEDGNITGDLDIRDDLIIQGANRDTTIIEGINIHRNIHIVIAGLKVKISGLTVARNDTNKGLPGAGIYNNAKLDLDNVIVTENYSGTDGGGIHNAGTLTMTNSIVTENEAFSGKGGGIFNSGVLNLTDSEVTMNSAGMNGGGITNGGGVMTLRNVVVKQNMVTIGSQGGGINIGGSATSTIIDSDIVSNSILSGNGGGIYAGIFQTTVILNSTIRNNNAAGYGGGIYNNGSITVMNSTISGNFAGQGGGVSAEGNGSSQTFMYSTIANNTATYDNETSGIEWANTADRTTFEGVILAGNGNGDDNCWGLMPPVSNGYNLDSGTSCGFSEPTDLDNTNPLIGPLADNGGATLTHALNAASPAIDLGGGPNCPDEDQRHASRPKDGDGNGSMVCDIGAFEFFNPSDYAYMSAIFRP